MATLGKSLQENVLTLLVHSEQHGKIISRMAPASLFDGSYRIIAQRALGFWKEYDTAPAGHMSDLLDDILNDPKSRQRDLMADILRMMTELAPTINTTFAIGELEKFIRLQGIKQGLYKMAECVQALQEHSIPEVEGLMAKMLREGDSKFDPGISCGDVSHLLVKLDDYNEREFRSGIQLLDRCHVVPGRGKLWVIIGIGGSGKSWCLVHLGRRALAIRKKVLYLSLELDEDEVQRRFFQSGFGLATREDELQAKLTGLKLDAEDRFLGFEPRDVSAPFSFNDPDIKAKLEKMLKQRIMGQKNFDNVRIKRFPMKDLTINELEVFLDDLKLRQEFEPDMLLLDYAELMRIDTKDYRLSLGNLFRELRGMAVKRNIALVTAHQSNREGASAKKVSSVNIAEDWSLQGTADFVLALTRTDEEAAQGLARLYVAKARDGRDKFSVVMEQDIVHGRFCGKSCLEPRDYLKKLEEYLK